MPIADPIVVRVRLVQPVIQGTEVNETRSPLVTLYGGFLIVSGPIPTEQIVDLGMTIKGIEYSAGAATVWVVAPLQAFLPFQNRFDKQAIPSRWIKVPYGYYIEDVTVQMLKMWWPNDDDEVYNAESIA